MITVNIDNCTFTLQPENAENVRALCANIKTKGKGRKFKPDTPGLKMVRQYPLVHNWSTHDYVRAYEYLNERIFGSDSVDRFAPMNQAPATHYDPTTPICEEITE